MGQYGIFQAYTGQYGTFLAYNGTVWYFPGLHWTVWLLTGIKLDIIIDCRQIPGQYDTFQACNWTSTGPCSYLQDRRLLLKTE